MIHQINELFLSVWFHFSESVSPGAESLHLLFMYYLIAALFVFFSVTGCITYILLKYRARQGGSDDEPPQIHGNRKVEISLTLLATGLVGIFFYLTLSTMFETNEPAGDQQPDLVITGHQWWWEVEYPETGAITADEIHVPVGKKVLLRLVSADVIHSWWVPDLGRKMDLIPGKINHLWLEVEKPGTYLGACSEFCGAQHAWMRIRVIAQSPDAFKHWQQHQARPAAQTAPADSMAALGQRLFHRLTCGNCHAIRGTEANGKIGPDLTHLADRQTLLAGKLTNAPGNVRRWLNDPQKVKEGAHMPRFILEKKQLDALTSYLEGLQ